eukprot:6977443-Pyramimonas_sp.AAC.1
MTEQDRSRKGSGVKQPNGPDPGSPTVVARRGPLLGRWGFLLPLPLPPPTVGSRRVDQRRPRRRRS